MKRINFFVLILAFLTITIGIGVIVLFNKKEQRLSYIHLQKVYGEFAMTKEMSKRLDDVVQKRKSILDSLGLQIQFSDKTYKGKGKNTNGEINRLKQQFAQLESQYEEDNALLQQQLNSQILKQLTQYVSDYGKEKDCDYILGANGDGVLMYGKVGNDISEEVIVYINNKYKGDAKK